MNQNDPTEAAARQFRARVLDLAEQLSLGEDNRTLSTDAVADIVTSEAALLRREGPAAYLVHVARMNAGARETLPPLPSGPLYLVASAPASPVTHTSSIHSRNGRQHGGGGLTGRAGR